MDGDHEAEESEKVRSYGIEIDRQKIKRIPENEQSTALKDLGVSIYEQEEFEESVLQQVDDAIEEQKRRISIKAAEKNLQNIKDDIKSAEAEIEKVEKAISACQGAASNDYHVKRSLASLNSHKETKVKQLERLRAREKYACKDLDELISKINENKVDGSVKEHRNFDLEEFGMVDFEGTKELHTEFHVNKPSTSKQSQEESFEQDDFVNKYDRIKRRKRQLDIRNEFSDSYSSSEEYIPYPDEVSDDLTSEEDEEDNNLRSKATYVPKKKQKQEIGMHHQAMKAKLKSKKSKTPKKVVDDGNIIAYQQRIKELRLKNRLKKTGSLDTVADSDLSEDEENDDKEIALKGGFSLPVKLWRKLYKYQRTGVKWLWELHCQDVGGILGDEMGLGKTIQIIAFLTGLRNLLHKDNRFGPTIIVSPATVLHQWVKEFHKWSPEFRVAVLHETGSFLGRREALINHIAKDKGVVVTSYTNLRIHQDELLRYQWEYIILDEGHKIRNPDAEITLTCKQFATSHRLILSGSPLQNNLRELWSLFDFIYPGKLGTLPVFMSEFAVPITAGGYANATDVQVQIAYKCACVLRDTISPYLLRRMKKDVNTSLNLPTKNEQVLFCRLTEEQRDLYKRYINSRDVVSILSGKMKVFPGLIMLRKICNHPDLSSSAGSLDWMNSTKESAESETNVDGKPGGDYGFWKRSGKMIVVESLLRLWKEQNHKVLLFSQTRQMLDILESFVKESSYSYLRMDGSTSVGSRQPLIEKFNQDKSIFVFLLTTRVGGLGVNLVGSNRVIIFDPDWNPSTDTQARERSWRIGQERHVTIYRLLTTGTIEEKIYHRQIFKQFLTNRVLKNPAQRRFFKSNDLYELFCLGDEGPRNNTETNAIFAGTGSEIKLGGNKDKLQKVGSKAVKKIKKDIRTNITKKSKQRFVKETSSTVISTEDPENLDKKQRERTQTDKIQKDTSNCQKDVWSIRGDDIPAQCEMISKDGVVGEDAGNADSKIADKFICTPRNISENGEASELPQKDSETEKNLILAKNSIQASSSKRCIIEQGKKKKKKRKRKNAEVEGTEIDFLDKNTRHQHKDEEQDVKKKDEDVLMAIFDKTGVHSALKHDKIEESGNPDYVLVENEAKRVAKHAADALRKSRALCRNAEIGVPTWTGNNGSAGLTSKKPRFGMKRKSLVQNTSDSSTSKKTSFDGSELIEKANTEDLSSASLLNKMRARKALEGRSAEAELDHNQYRIQGQAYGSEEEELIKEIRHFVALRAKHTGQATTQEILKEFKAKIDGHKNALFKEMLKHVCYFRKENGEGTWFLKEEYN
ncbi:DNA excision repair protein ERCC-6-like [Rhopilema esculentum]|uniref:DNA excision repair protein ERCC-6-like n=1 Tax=Rhopilema esculentum TaxID=499914 RepID=UPI0031D72421